MPVENLSALEARKQIDKSKDKLQLLVTHSGSALKSYHDPSSLKQHQQPGDHI